MTSGSAASRFRHVAVESPSGSHADLSRLTDRQRLAIVVQAAALLSHLEVGGLHLASEWNEIAIDRRGLLRGAQIATGSERSSASSRLIDLIQMIFGARDRVIGKGSAKKTVDALLLAWGRSLGEMPIHRIVCRLLGAVTFLWQPAFGPTRKFLVAEIEEAGARRVLIAGYGGFEQRVLRQSSDYSRLLKLMASTEAEKYWHGTKVDSRAACEADLARGRCLFGTGKWQESLTAIQGSSSMESKLLAVECQRMLGKYRIARRTLEGLALESNLTPDMRARIAEVGAALSIETEDDSGAFGWSERLESVQGERHGLLELVLRGEAAVATGQWTVVRTLLRSATDNLTTDRFWWRWQRLRALEALTRGRYDEASEAVTAALRTGRRTMPKLEAAAMWSVLARTRVEAGGMKLASKAARHALRLADGVDDAMAWAASRLLAEIRMRQGERVSLDSLAHGVVSERRSVTVAICPDLAELRARFQLNSGHPAAAWGILETIVVDLAPHPPWRSARLRSLAARSLGWLGRGAGAREILETDCAAPLMGLEEEEYPALWALAGDWQRAREVADKGTVGRVWRTALLGEPFESFDWLSAVGLEPFRAARMVLDLRLLRAPASVPRRTLSWAASELRSAGAVGFAERLDRHGEGTWKALTGYLRGGSGTMREIGQLFRKAGYFDIRLVWRDATATRCLVSGQGGDDELKTDLGLGELVLQAQAIDSVLEALFVLASRELRPELEEEAAGTRSISGIVGQSAALRVALDRLERLARTRLSVLIQGETGTGKELAARQLHRWSPRSDKPFVAVNCAALSESLLLSDLFGHVRGAFTGADRSRAGLFEAASGGTVLLDEIGDLPLVAQGKLLRVLQEGEVRRVGESLPRRVDVRVVAATHRQLHAMVENGSFRRDLYYRMKVGSVDLPPLRRREGDVLLLSQHFLHGSGRRLTSRARRLLMQHDWPGNIRELRNVLEVALALSPGRLIHARAIELPSGVEVRRVGYHRQVEEYRRRLVREALEATAGHRGEAARRLELSRQALSYLVRRLGIEVP